MAEGAVTRELVSWSDFPDQQGKYRENRPEKDYLSPIAVRKALQRLKLFAEFPTQWNREPFWQIREPKRRIRESVNPSLRYGHGRGGGFSVAAPASVI